MNKSAIKQMATLVWFTFISVSLWGQGFHVYTKDGQRHDFLHADVDSIVFASDAIGEEQPPIELPTVAEAVDLGLPSGTKWASWNVGASSPEEYGGYYAWGEVEEKSEYTQFTYLYCDPVWNDYINLGSNIASTSYDVAHVKWGDLWRMPTTDEINELWTSCEWVWIHYNGTTEGYQVTGPNGNRIFLPAAGYFEGTKLHKQGERGSYWLSNSTAENGAAGIGFDGTTDKAYSYMRYVGRSVRPVYDDGSSTEDVDPVITGNAISVNSSSVLVEGTCNTVENLGNNYKLGFLYNTTGNPSYDNADFIAVDTRAVGQFSTTLEGLSPATTYYYCACIRLSADTWYYGGTKSFTTSKNVAEAVDLGLPSGTKWASWNVGAHSPEEYGGYYAWGEVEEKSEYSWSNYKWCDGERTSITKYGVNSSYGIVDNLTTLDAGDDVAQMEWGEGWRMPTNDEIKELFDECKWSWTFVNGVNGQLVTGPNGNSIFMPAAGFYKDNQVKGGGSYLSYLSSSLYLNGGSCGVAVLYFFSGNNNWDDTWGRCYGRSVRPVCE